MVEEKQFLCVLSLTLPLLLFGTSCTQWDPRLPSFAPCSAEGFAKASRRYGGRGAGMVEEKLLLLCRIFEFAGALFSVILYSTGSPPSLLCALLRRRLREGEQTLRRARRGDG
jgi:hypothetical protein